jgi:glutathione-specific gamma-glutamylcyclotransferase
LDYVRKREMITGVYREIVKRVYMGEAVEPVLAVTYAVDRKHPQCAPPLSVEDTMAFVAQGHGLSGSCADYVGNTLRHLRAMGQHDAELERLAPALENLGGAHP